jgi:hypothetical protein
MGLYIESSWSYKSCVPGDYPPEPPGSASLERLPMPPQPRDAFVLTEWPKEISKALERSEPGGPGGIPPKERSMIGFTRTEPKAKIRARGAPPRKADSNEGIRLP